MEVKVNYRSDCPICLSLDVLGDKWSFLIIRDLMIYEKNTYGDFLKMEENIATNILADRLLSLEKANIISKEVYSGSKSKFFYKLTPKGIDLIPVALELMIWAEKHHDVKPLLKQILKEASQNKEVFIKNLSGKLQLVKPKLKSE